MELLQKTSMPIHIDKIDAEPVGLKQKRPKIDATTRYCHLFKIY